MAVSDIEAVLEFLRKNGFSESESALREDVLEKSKPQLGSSDFQKFLFPMVPPPPRLKVNVNNSRRLPEFPVQSVGKDDDLSSRLDDSDEEEFVSLGSSTSEFCSSEFTNPYGIHTDTRLSSRSSSENLSEFGTARDYHEFDMQNDLNWYKERDEDYAMPPHFGILDYEEGPSEDKFVTTLETGDTSLNRTNSSSDELQFASNNDYHDKKPRLNLKESVSNGVSEDYFDLEKTEQKERYINVDREGFPDYCCSAPSGTSSEGLGSPHDRGSGDHGSTKLKVAEQEAHTAFSLCNSTKDKFAYDWDRDLSIKDDLGPFVVKEDNYIKEKKHDEYADNVTIGEICDPDPTAEAEVAANDEVLMYDAKEDDFEVFNLKIIHRKNRTGFEENKDFPVVINSLIASRYYVTEYLGSAAFSKVIQAHDTYSGMDVCLKIIKNDKDFFDQSLDEIKLLKLANKYDPGDERHILRLYDYFYHQEHLFIVCELLRANLYEFLKYNQESGGEAYFTLTRLQIITQQCLEALEYLHHLGIIHCDLKPENILIRSYRRCEIKIIDLGSSCFQSDNLSLYVQSRSYRAPEVILGLPYDQRIDLWSLGCILAELYSGEVLFPNEAIAMLLARMIAILGPIDMDMLESGQEAHKYFTKEYDLYVINEETNELEYVLPPEPSSLEQHLQISDALFLDFLSKLLEINPQRRLTAREALEHPWLSHVYEPSASEFC